MKSIGVRQLRQNASEYLRLVKAGERIEVTDRGEPVGYLVPVATDPVERLIQKGVLLPAERSGDLLDIEPREPTPGVPLPSVLLEQDRADGGF
jgi:prevent-host-death family protein